MGQLAFDRHRDWQQTVTERFDLIVAGGGIYGACLALEGARRGLRVLLFERHDFGCETSANSLRILHGGLRYLQRGDLIRFFESARERNWFFHQFPDLVAPLPCLMPIYNQGARRTSVVQAGLWVDAVLSRWATSGECAAPLTCPRGRLLDVSQVIARCPDLTRRSLRGGALWWGWPDAVAIPAADRDP